MPGNTGIAIPRLSETLHPIAWPHRCQRCHGPGPLGRWREHDDADRPEMIFVLLCELCADRVIEPHPRLYAGLETNEPAPGVMAICEGCSHQSAGRCLSPLAKANGGPGLPFPAPDSTAHIQYADKKGRRCGRWIKMWAEQPKECEGFEPREAPRPIAP